MYTSHFPQLALGQGSRGVVQSGGQLWGKNNVYTAIDAIGSRVKELTGYPNLPLLWPEWDQPMKTENCQGGPKGISHCLIATCGACEETASAHVSHVHLSCWI